jgi:ADP-ribose pyrophosphatase YjhB (NUDIX family)
MRPDFSHRRSDSVNWALPGGAMDIGETFAQSAIRNIKVETGPISTLIA